MFSQAYRFEKIVPEDEQEKAALAESLLKYGISLFQYEKACDMEDITMYAT